MSDITTTIVAACKDYGISADEFRAAAATELLLSGSMAAATGKNNEQQLTSMVDTLDGVLETREIMSALCWATWLKHARKEDLPGQDTASLLKVRQEGINL